MAFASSFLECLALVVTRVHNLEMAEASSSEDQSSSVPTIKLESSLVTSQVGLFWRNCLNNTLSVKSDELGSIFSKLLSRLQNVDNGERY